VPLIYVGRSAKFLPGTGSLSDVAPTLLSIMDIKQPDEMTGQSLIKLLKDKTPAIIGK
jgi:2,3-bisphosphoglycerate-independent phosphoglycerate mutase